VRAVVCRALGSLENLEVEEHQDPAPGPGQILVEVAAAGATFVDALIAQGRYQLRPHAPYIPGGEVAGVVAGVGTGVDGALVGTRVMSMCGLGGFAEKVAVPAVATAAVPDEVDTSVAATFTQGYCTADFALRQRGGLRRGEKVLVLGAGGALGQACTDLARALGASVIGVASSAAKRRAAARAGAGATIEPDAATLKDTVRELSDGGVDLVVDPVGGDMAAPALRSLAVGGRYLVVGFASGAIPALPLNQVLLRNRSVLGVDWGAWAMAHPAEQRALADRLAMAAEGGLAPPAPRRLPLERAAEALGDFVARRAVGTVVLVP
jgi:NADPH2:quinone reductase